MNLKEEFLSCMGAIQYFTRIPIKFRINYNYIKYNSIVYLPFIGIIIGILDIFLFKGLIIIFKEIEIGIILMMIFHTFITGGLHEDGVSDFVDGFGGGYEKQKILEIMKDPNIGNFGALSIIYLILLKFILLKYLFINIGIFFIIFIIIQFLSRIILIYFMKFLPYARDVGKAKMFESISNGRFWIFQIIYFISLCFILYYYDSYILLFLIFIIYLIIIYYFFYKLLLSKIDGYTGDTLGAIQQISEIGLYIVCILYFIYSKNFMI
ncbi:MAG: hypothetical protein KatS3mg129_2828 [Leptospiraceae bacterium]|nr:MAG: hypothetical protein KatS3mg129_2828 [Leptospiraceae bacterium]